MVWSPCHGNPWGVGCNCYTDNVHQCYQRKSTTNQPSVRGDAIIVNMPGSSKQRSQCLFGVISLNMGKLTNGRSTYADHRELSCWFISSLDLVSFTVVSCKLVEL